MVYDLAPAQLLLRHLESRVLAFTRIEVRVVRLDEDFPTLSPLIALGSGFATLGAMRMSPVATGEGAIPPHRQESFSSVVTFSAVRCAVR